MDQHYEHAYFLSTITSLPIISSNSDLSLESEQGHSASAQLSSLLEMRPNYQSSADSTYTSSSQSIPTKYRFTSNLYHHTRRFCQDYLTNTWVLELAALALTTMSMGGLIITLLVHQNKAAPQWRWGLTLNPILSILSQIVTLSITTVLAGALSQHKWLWFLKSTRPLKDFDQFEETSRGGPWGNLMFLSHKSRLFHLGALGAVAMLLMQAFQPFIQQVATYPSRWEAAPHSNATVPRSISFEIVDGFYANTKQTYVANSIKAGVYNGLYNNQTSLSDVQPSCSSGRCSWKPHSTLGICAYLADVSPFIQKHTYSSSSNNETTFYALPSGGLLAEPYSNMSLVTTDNARFLSLAFRNTSSTAVLDNFYTFFFSDQTGIPTLLETSLQLCVQTLNITVTDGQTETEVLSYFTDVSEDGGHKVIVPGDNNNYLMGDYSFGTLRDFLTKTINGTFTVAADGSITYGSDAIEVLVDTLLGEPYDQAAMAIFLKGFANSVTNALRSHHSASTPFPGTLYLQRTYVSVSWPWITLPVFIVLLATLFLLATIVRNRSGGLEVWRGSALASLQALSDVAREELGKGLGSPSSMEGRAEEVHVRLRKDGTGRWVLR